MSDRRTQDVIDTIEALMQLTDDVPLIIREAHDALVEEFADARRYRWMVANVVTLITGKSRWEKRTLDSIADKAMQQEEP